MMKLNKLALACGVAILGATTVAQAEFSANIGVTSNYMWRGTTQTDDGAAVQGGLDWAHDSGFYLGTWASNIKWGSDMSSGAEVDFYGGFANSINDFGYDLGVIYYYYPDDDYDDSDFTELYASGSYKWFEAGLAYTVSGDADDAPYSDGDLYYHAGVSFDIQDGWSIGGTIGYYDFDTELKDELEDYTHYQLDIGKSAGDFGDFTFSVSKADEDSGDDDTKFFVSWGKSF
jgi:uncharacterized protein (TIGR02001 family)